MSKIRFLGHDTTKRIKRDNSDLYKRILKLFDTEPMFKKLKYDKLKDEFEYEWRFNIRQELIKHMLLADCWLEDINPYNILKVYPTNICDGRVFIRSVIVPRINNTDIADIKVKSINKFKYQCNLEIGVYTTDGYDAVVFENLYDSET